MALLVKNLPANAGDTRHVGSVPWSGRSPGRGHGNPLQYPSLENPMDRGAWWSMVHRVAKSQTWQKQLSTHTHTYIFRVRIEECMFEHDLILLYYYAQVAFQMEKAMATHHSSTLAWKIPWTEEPGGLQSMGLLRVGHDWSNLAAAAFQKILQDSLSPVFLFFDSTGWLDCNSHCFNGVFHLPRDPTSWTLYTPGKWDKIRSII